VTWLFRDASVGRYRSIDLEKICSRRDDGETEKAIAMEKVKDEINTAVKNEVKSKRIIDNYAV